MKRRVEIRWIFLILTALLTACVTGEDIGSSPATDDEDCYLTIYVYAPDRPVVTRADVGEIAHRTEAESTVHTLKIWVFNHTDGKMIGYLDGTDDQPYLINEKGYQMFKMKLDRNFAEHPGNVDVYAVANEASCGLSLSSSSDLDNAMIGSGYFGTGTLVNEVPTNGLPMSAKLTNMKVKGKFPTLYIADTGDEMASLKLTRAVSKLRFVLCRIKEKEGVTKKLESIDEISLDATKIPATSYLIAPSDDYSYPSTFFSTTPSSITYTINITKENIPDVEDPLVYAYSTQTAQDFEDLINYAIEGKKTDGTDLGEQLKELGLTYFRESDKQLTGTIKYTLEGTEQQETVQFSMAAPGDFLRNHSWTVYIYFMDTEIHVLTVTNIGMRSWINGGSQDNPVYNW